MTFLLPHCRMELVVQKQSNNSQACSNKVFINESTNIDTDYVIIKGYFYKLSKEAPEVPDGVITLNSVQRNKLFVHLQEQVTVTPYKFTGRERKVLEVGVRVKTIKWSVTLSITKSDLFGMFYGLSLPMLVNKGQELICHHNNDYYTFVLDNLLCEVPLSWDLARLIWIAQSDCNTPFYGLPKEIITLIIQHSTSEKNSDHGLCTLETKCKISSWVKNLIVVSDDKEKSISNLLTGYNIVSKIDVETFDSAIFGSTGTRGVLLSGSSSNKAAFALQIGKMICSSPIFVDGFTLINEHVNNAGMDLDMLDLCFTDKLLHHISPVLIVEHIDALFKRGNYAQRFYEYVVNYGKDLLLIGICSEPNNVPKDWLSKEVFRIQLILDSSYCTVIES
eukprot:TRINITY_DN4335_c0_g1_i1.p1 TRINITY_DN4335_c0_g1~~TRINITY_DN4335_c0_g1_i1.p1  ORF type:complete len:391 (+),score=36.21 TRINITY_DN4335_c0_g1_i1:707-1879(+)